MIILNEIVKHDIFGLGIITEIQDHRITVKFEDEIETKIFLYPEAFEKYLIAANPEIESHALDELRIKKEQMQLESEEKEREADELREKIEKISNVKKKRVTKSRKK
ncbi:hypothetical protein [Clostridium sp. L74]|uniref:hypothetical protein n=1 Tax=Clostridium sp. L74 TaxID=1560217 RepID=UPI0006ABA42C|nr:hypothetical protein [Clostridium sp. L74]KOR24712.1 hypothetical protein ND00_21590 [Clostridium sp. L74]